MSPNGKYFNYDITTPEDVIKRLQPLFSDKSKYDKYANDFAPAKLNFNFSDAYYYHMQDFIFEFIWTQFPFINNTEVYYNLSVNVDIIIENKHSKKNPNGTKVSNIRITSKAMLFHPLFNNFKLIIAPVKLHIIYENECVDSHSTFVVYDIETKVVEFIDSADHGNGAVLLKKMPKVYEKLLIKQGFNPNIVISSYKITKKPRKDNIQREGETRNYNPMYQKNKKNYKSIFNIELEPKGYCTIWTFMFIDAIMQNLNFNVDQVKLRNKLKLELVKHIAKQGSVTRFVRTYTIRLFSCIYRTCLLIVKHKKYKDTTFARIPLKIIMDATKIACPTPIYDLTLENLQK